MEGDRKEGGEERGSGETERGGRREIRRREEEREGGRGVSSNDIPFRNPL